MQNREHIAALGVSIDAAEVAELATALIRIPTVPSLHPQGEAEAVACLAQVLDREQIPYEVEEVSPGRPNLVIEMGRRSGPTLWFNGHLDTVPIGNRLHWRHEPFGGDEIDGLLYGRGASDCKGGVAAMVHAAIALKRAGARIPGRLIFSAVMGEEEGQIGRIDSLLVQCEEDRPLLGMEEIIRILHAFGDALVGQQRPHLVGGDEGSELVVGDFGIDCHVKRSASGLRAGPGRSRAARAAR